MIRKKSMQEELDRCLPADRPGFSLVYLNKMAKLKLSVQILMIIQN
jgi:hypothetical protein